MESSNWGDHTLQDIAITFSSCGDVSSEDEEKDWLVASDEECLRFVKKHYTDGKCGEWAYVLNKKTGWRIMHMARPKNNQHYYCETPEGFVVDAEGISTLGSLKKRFKLRTAPIIQEVDPAELAERYRGDEERVVQFASLVMDRLSFLQEVHGTAVPAAAP